MRKERLIITTFLVFLVLAVSGCVQQPSGPVYNPPYIVKGYDCCLDQDSNNICDSDEEEPGQPQEPPQPEEPAAYCGDAGCDPDENCSSCPQDCGECPVTINDTAKEIKTIVYDTVRKYVPMAAAGDFEYGPRPNETVAFDTWHYPDFLANVNTSKHVVYASIKDYHFGLGAPKSLYDRLVESPEYGTSEIYMKNLENGNIVVTDKDIKSGTPGSGRYDFSVELTCNRTYDIRIYTWDYYGTDVLPIYKDYNIDRFEIEKAASEILGTC